MEIQDRLTQLRTQMTMSEDKVIPGAKKAFDVFYAAKGIAGIEAMFQAGWNTPELVHQFYIQSFRDTSRMASNLEIK